MLIKVCGISHQASSVAEIADLIGFIYYNHSPRFTNCPPATSDVLRVGVFVNEKPAVIIPLITKDQLDFVQLHGDETPQTCEEIKQYCKVIKAFGIENQTDFDKTKNYQCDYFLFDTKGALRGGNGSRFNWEILDQYDGSTSFILSGGIGPDHINEIRQIKHTKFAGIDLNSQFEISPGNKNVELLKKTIDELRS